MKQPDKYNPLLTIASLLSILFMFMVMAVLSAAQAIFVSVVYHNINGDPIKNFDEQFADKLFRSK